MMRRGCVVNYKHWRGREVAFGEIDYDGEQWLWEAATRAQMTLRGQSREEVKRAVASLGRHLRNLPELAFFDDTALAIQAFDESIAHIALGSAVSSQPAQQQWDRIDEAQMGPTPAGCFDAAGNPNELYHEWMKARISTIARTNELWKGAWTNGPSPRADGATAEAVPAAAESFRLQPQKAVIRPVASAERHPAGDDRQRPRARPISQGDSVASAMRSIPRRWLALHPACRSQRGDGVGWTSSTRTRRARVGSICRCCDGPVQVLRPQILTSSRDDEALARRDTRWSGSLGTATSGCQITSVRFTERIEDIGARPSIGTVADCFGDALAETSRLLQGDRVRPRSTAHAASSIERASS
jgi:hypothetical protein